MQNERLLKQVTVCSILLLCFVLVFSHRNQALLYAEGLEQQSEEAEDVTPGPTIVLTPMPVLTLTPTPMPTASLTPTPTPTKAPSGPWVRVAGAQTSDLIKQFEENGTKTIVIEKRGAAYEEAGLTLEELPVERKIRVTIHGAIEGEITAAQIYRISEETFYEGNPPSPTPTPSPTPEPSITPTPEPSVTLSPTPVPTLSPDDPLYPWRFDPVKGLEISTKTNEDGTQDVTLLFTLDKTYVYQVEEDENNYYISLLRPKDVYKKIVVIDAGHGGLDSGTYSKGETYLEKTINLNIVLYLKELLKNEPGIKVYYTRVTDCRPSLNQRVNLANDVEADFFLSVHCNANVARSLNGTEVLYSAAQNSWEGMNSKQFAQICMDKLDEYLGLKNRGLVPRDHNVTIIKEAQMPVALAEVAFMSNAADMKVLAKEESQRNIARALYEAILEAYRQLEAEEARTEAESESKEE